VSGWNWQEGQEIQTLCYTNCDAVELFLNGASLGSQSSEDARRGMLLWNVPFEAGTLKAVGKRNGNALCEYNLQTTGEPQKIKLSPDTTNLTADGKDVCYLEFAVTDAKGVRIQNAENEITFTVSGPAELTAVGNGNPASHQSHVNNTHNAWQGQGLAIIRTERTPGTVTVKAAAEGLEPAQITLQTH
jgi:beta-galactosidase